MKAFSVKNFDRFQHYKDRSPPWIKLYGELLEDYDFGVLPDVAKGHLLSIWLLASRMGNKLPFNAAWVGNKINATEPVDLEMLVDAGFLIPHTEEAERGKLENWSSRYISDAVRDEVLAEADHKCVTCKSTVHLEIDHIVPISRGGNSEKANLQVLCRACNRKKRAKLTYAGAEQVATQLRRPETEGERETERERKTLPGTPGGAVIAKTIPEDFETFWKAYNGPKNSKKPDALKAWAATAKIRPPLPDLLRAVANYSAWVVDEGRKQKRDYPKQHHSTWLRGEMWNNYGDGGSVLTPEQIAENKDRADRFWKRGKYAEQMT